MAINIESKRGTVTIDNFVVAKIAGYTAIDCYGIVGMAGRSMKDGLVRLLKLQSLTKGISVTTEGQELVIDLHIIVEYGTNVPAICESIISTVKYKVEECTGVTVKCVNVIVDGIRIEQ